MKGSNYQGRVCSEDGEVPVGCSGTVFTPRIQGAEGRQQRMDILGTRGRCCRLIELLFADHLGGACAAELGYPPLQTKELLGVTVRC